MRFCELAGPRLSSRSRPTPGRLRGGFCDRLDILGSPSRIAPEQGAAGQQSGRFQFDCSLRSFRPACGRAFCVRRHSRHATHYPARRCNMPTQHTVVHTQRGIRVAFKFRDVLETCHLVISEIIRVDSCGRFSRAAHQTLTTVSPNHALHRDAGGRFRTHNMILSYTPAVARKSFLR